MEIKVNIPSPLHPIRLSSGQQIYVKREDLIHPLLSGNKFRKLKYNIKVALNTKCEQIISFGGAYSNHIHALSFACNQYQIPLKLFIRGEKISNPTLNFVRKNNVELIFIDRSLYRKRNEEKFIINIKSKYPKSFIIPEGGTNINALKGMNEMMDEIKNEIANEPTNYCVAYGSGGTSIGMMKALNPSDKLNIFPVLKMENIKADFLNHCDQLNVDPCNYSIHEGYHFGGYAKFNTELIDFINKFKRTYGIALDPIYTGKLFYGVLSLIKEDYFKKDEKIVIIHSGGLQGIEGFNLRNNKIIK